MERIWIDAADFSARGGFILETQFVAEMGCAYLMADGVGTPVAPASVTFSVKEGGHYRIWLYTKNWCPDYGPDGLFVTVDGQRSQHVSGLMTVRGWYFEIAGDFVLAPGQHTLTVSDTEGWFGRFGACIVTNDYDFTPSPALPKFYEQRAALRGASLLPTHLGHFDFIVVGGGVGGVVTAITAARGGLRTALLSARPRLGGNAAEEANVALEGAAHRGYQETGVVYEIKNYRHKQEISWSEAFARFTAAEENLTVYDNMLVTGAVCEEGVIRSISARDTVTLETFTLSADLFTDASGDGWLGYYADAAYRVGREPAFLHGEEFAPADADGNTMSGCATRASNSLHETTCAYFAEEEDAPVPFTPPAWAFRLPEGDSLGRVPDRLDCGRWWLEMPNDYDDLFDSEFVRDSMFRMALGYFDWLKNSWPDREKAAKYRLRALGTYLAKRESRRLMGDTVMTEHDFVEGKTFPDAVAYCGWNIDVHHVNGIFSGKDGMFSLDRKIPITPIPFGALYSKNIENLFMVGRCMSVTHIALGAVRVMLTIATTGQAVAEGAVLCKKYNVTPRTVRKKYIGELQQKLLKDGNYIPGVTNQDPADRARTATVTATSETEGGEAENVRNGKTRPQQGSHAWISEKGLPQAITLTLDRPTPLSEVRLVLGMPLDRYRYGYMPQPAPEELATALSLELLTDGAWREVATVEDNYQHLVILTFPTTEAAALRITVKEAHSADCAVIVEVRAY